MLQYTLCKLLNYNILSFHSQESFIVDLRSSANKNEEILPNEIILSTLLTYGSRKIELNLEIMKYIYLYDGHV